tara:strand:+ start:2924 stop:3283 length:360 start_codon:yes stop_codon:yes gene_type:complete
MTRKRGRQKIKKKHKNNNNNNKPKNNKEKKHKKTLSGGGNFDRIKNLVSTINSTIKDKANSFYQKTKFNATQKINFMKDRASQEVTNKKNLLENSKNTVKDKFLTAKNGFKKKIDCISN